MDVASDARYSTCKDGSIKFELIRLQIVENELYMIDESCAMSEKDRDRFLTVKYDVFARVQHCLKIPRDFSDEWLIAHTIECRKGGLEEWSLILLISGSRSRPPARSHFAVLAFCCPYLKGLGCGIFSDNRHGRDRDKATSVVASVAAEWSSCLF